MSIIVPKSERSIRYDLQESSKNFAEITSFEFSLRNPKRCCEHFGEEENVKTRSVVSSQLSSIDPIF